MKFNESTAMPKLGEIIPFPAKCLTETLGRLSLHVPGEDPVEKEVRRTRVRRHPERCCHEITFVCPGVVVRVSLADPLIAELLRNLPFPPPPVAAAA